jgi:hypothetical protein
MVSPPQEVMMPADAGEVVVDSRLFVVRPGSDTFHPGGGDCRSEERTDVHIRETTD